MDSSIKKKLLAAFAFMLLIAAVITVSVINFNNNKDKNAAVSASDRPAYSDSADALREADFPIQYSDRLCGYPAAGYYADSGTVLIDYGGMGCTRKSLAAVSPTDCTENARDFDESSERDIGGVNVTFYGIGGKVYLAVWTDNNFDYMISLEDQTGGVSAAEMTDYVMATR